MTIAAVLTVEQLVYIEELIMTNITDLSSSLSGAMDSLLSSLRTLAPSVETVIGDEGTEWFYEINKKAMVRVPIGTQIKVMSKYPADEQGRLVAQTANGDIIRIPIERVMKVGFH
jgi:hypothetical protein